MPLPEVRGPYGPCTCCCRRRGHKPDFKIKFKATISQQHILIKYLRISGFQIQYSMAKSKCFNSQGVNGRYEYANSSLLILPEALDGHLPGTETDALAAAAAAAAANYAVALRQQSPPVAAA